MKLKRILPDVLCVVVFALLGLAYFLAPIRDGLVLTGTDHSAAVGSNHEMEVYRQTHDGQRTRWTNTLFSGMPTYQMAPSYPSTDMLSGIESVYRLFLPDVAAYIFILLLGFYIMLRAFNFRPYLAALGAVLWAFSSYYLIIIGAGHIWKLLTLAFIPPTIAGVVLCYRGRYVLGTAALGLFTALQIVSNHVQMTYYFALVMGLIVVAYLIEALRTHKLRRWARGTVGVLVGGLLGLSVNASNLYHTYAYSQESMRSASELTQKHKDAADQTASGLERSYITQWSYGIDETWTLLVPGCKGNGSIPMSQSAAAMTKARPEYQSIYGQVGQYWGEQPGTSGPVYVGALVCFLFILGLLIVKGPMKWALLVATVLSIVLSWGKNLMPVTDFFLDYVPMYDKFRTVASILVIAEFTMPLLAIMALGRMIAEPDMLRTRTFRIKAGVALALTALPCLAMWMAPDLCFGGYFSQEEGTYLSGLVSQGQLPADLMTNLADMRRAMLTSDALRSLLIILVGVAALAAFAYRKINDKVMVGILTVVCLFDLWQVDKRYMNDEMFTTARPADQSIPMTEADAQILQDKDPYYRVLNANVSTFNDNTTSLRHKSIGGYHAAKLRRYQELIEAHIAPEMQRMGEHMFQTSAGAVFEASDSLFPVLNMLNTRYVIVSDKLAARNPYAMGNAWMVDRLKYVDNADEELSALSREPLRRVAVADRRFASALGGEESAAGKVSLTAYAPNSLSYKVDAPRGGVMVMSDVYYPGWTCTVDGKEVPIGRVDYVLRAIRVEAGSHNVTMTFDPKSLHTTECVAYAALGLLAVLMALALKLEVYRRRKE